MSSDCNEREDIVDCEWVWLSSRETRVHSSLRRFRGVPSPATVCDATTPIEFYPCRRSVEAWRAACLFGWLSLAWSFTSEVPRSSHVMIYHRSPAETPSSIISEEDWNTKSWKTTTDYPMSCIGVFEDLGSAMASSAALKAAKKELRTLMKNKLSSVPSASIDTQSKPTCQ